jgi:hypothetical protein
MRQLGLTVEVDTMITAKIPARHELDGRAQPLVHWAAATSAAAIAATVALIVGSLWVAAAFGSHNAGFYNHLDWWLGGTLIGAAFLSSVLAGAIASTRGMAPGVLNGLTSWAIIALVLGAVVLVAVATGGTTTTLTTKTGSVAVAIIRPYPVFWAAAIGTVAAAAGGLAGGLWPRRRAAVSYVDGSTVGSTLVVDFAGNRPADRAAS